MKKTLFIALVATAAWQGSPAGFERPSRPRRMGELPQCREYLSSLRRQGAGIPYFSGTNAFGRTHAQECEHELAERERRSFLQFNPTGRDCFGRTYDELVAIRKNFDMEEFFGHSFGSELAARCTNSLAKPFRMLSREELVPTAKGRLGEVCLFSDTADVPQHDLETEVTRMAALLECVYGFEFVGHPHRIVGTGQFTGEEIDEYEFKNGNVSVSVGCGYDPMCGKGRIWLSATKVSLVDQDKWRKRQEDLAVVEGRQKHVSIPLLVGLDQLPEPFAKGIKEGIGEASSDIESGGTESLRRIRRVVGKSVKKVE